MFDLISDSSSSSFGLLPDGEYTLKILEVDLKDTRDMSGKYLDLCFEVAEGQHANRRLWIKFNLVNKSATAVNFALKNLKSYFEAAAIDCSQFDLDDNGQALTRRIMGQAQTVKASVVTQQGNNGYKSKNDVEPYSWAPAVVKSKDAPPPWAEVMRPKVPF